MATSLHELTRTNVRFRLGPDQEEAFQLLKEKTDNGPLIVIVLSIPQDEGTYYLDTDERMKRQYDISVRQQQHRKGQWALYYNPRRYQGRQQKWQRKFFLT